MKIYVLLSLIFLSTHNLANCFPESELRFSAYQKTMGGIDRWDFEQAIFQFENTWKPKVEKLMGKKLIIKGEWEEAKVNAHATRDDDNNLVIVILGGMARHPEMTKDGLLFILCHELGHHLGGAPKKFRGRSSKRSWSSAEGQADYFASTKCMYELYNQTADTKVLEYFYNEEDVSKVDKACDDYHCRRILLAGLSVGRVFASLKRDWERPEISKKDKSVVSQTVYRHPNPQCRMDTIVAGVECSKDRSLLTDDKDASVGYCYKEKASRPSCWFSPNSY